MAPNGISGKLLSTVTYFIDNRTQRVILNGILIYINDLSVNLASNPTLFAGGTSLFSAVKNVDASNIDLNNDLKKIGE